MILSFYRNIINKLFPKTKRSNKVTLALFLSSVTNVLLVVFVLSCLYIIGVMDIKYINKSSPVAKCIGSIDIYCTMYLTMYGIVSITNIILYSSVAIISVVVIFPLITMGFLKMLELHKSFGLIGLLPTIMVALLKMLDLHKELTVVCLLPLLILGLVKVIEMREYYENNL